MLEIMLRNIEFIISFNSLFILWNQLLPLASGFTPPEAHMSDLLPACGALGEGRTFKGWDLVGES